MKTATYSKFCPNVYLAKCQHVCERGEVIGVATRHGKVNECVIHNLIYQCDDYYYYSITRADGFNAQERAKKKVDKWASAAESSTMKSAAYYEASKEGREFLALGEPIKVGHHSERRHRALIDRNWDRMGKSVEASAKAIEQGAKADYWAGRTEDVNLSMPESIEYFTAKVEQKKQIHREYLDGTRKREHSFSLTYAKKEVNEAAKNLETAKRLWAIK